MLYDVFSFFQELDVLEVRLNEMEAIPCKHILIEATATHSGKKKPLYYEENKQRFDKFKDKIIHMVVDDPPMTGNAWDIERWQRDSVLDLSNNFNDTDLFIVSDVDEIPNVNTLYNTDWIYHLKDNKLCKLSQEMFYFYFNLQCVSKGWVSAYITDFKRLKFGPTYIRQNWRRKEGKLIRNCGWHFSFIGNKDTIKEKVKAYAHQEYNSNKYLSDDNIINSLTNGKDLFGRDMKFKVADDRILPIWLQNNKEKFNEFFYKRKNE